MNYKRYMVFTSDEYDNPGPFECLSFNTDNKRNALTFNDGSYSTIVFDRVDGCMIKQEYLVGTEEALKKISKHKRESNATDYSVIPPWVYKSLSTWDDKLNQNIEEQHKYLKYEESQRIQLQSNQAPLVFPFDHHCEGIRLMMLRKRLKGGE